MSGYDYDLLVIGGGSGGLSCSQTAGALGKKVAVLDFVKESPQGTTWGLGGTCVNVGCIPKKLMHQAALLSHAVEDARSFGWDLPESPEHSWPKLVSGVQDHIGSLNWGYRVALRSKEVTYFNAFGTFEDAHTVKTVNKRNKEQVITADKIVIAVGGRPNYPDIPGAREYGITSDDLFSRQSPPGKTLVVGASYVALECGGFLAGLGYDTTIMVRSILLRGFDQQMAEKIGDYMKNHKVKFIRPATPTKLEKNDKGKIVVTWSGDGMEGEEEFDTVLFAVGRSPCTNELNIEAAGVTLDSRGEIICNDSDQTNVDNIYAIGDVVKGRPELTPVAIHAGRLLAERLFKNATTLCDYTNVCTTVFTPLEYGACGLTEEQAIEQFGIDNIEVYHQSFQPLEYTVAHRETNACYAKLICNKADNERVVGLHVLGPQAGEITQGFGIAFKLNATKSDFDALIGIHPTNAEVFTKLTITKSSGVDETATGC